MAKINNRFNFADLKLLPLSVRKTVYLATLWMLLAALLDGLSGVLLVPIVKAWLASDPRAIGYWSSLLLIITLVQSVLLFYALQKGYLAGSTKAVGLIQGIIQHLPYVKDLAVLKPHQPEYLIRGSVFEAMTIPAHLLEPFIKAIITPLAVCIGLLFVEPVLAIYFVIILGLLLLLLKIANAKTYILEQARQEADLEMAHQLQVFANQQPLLRAVNQQATVTQTLQASLNSRHQQLLAILKQSLWAGLSFSACVQFIFITMLFSCWWAVKQQYLTTATVIASLILLFRFLEPLAQLTHLDQALRNALQALERILTILKIPLLSHTPSKTLPIDGSYEVNKVSYETEQHEILLDNISFCCPANSFTIIIGPSGAGKTTLLSLLARNMDSSSGNIWLGKAPIQTLTNEMLTQWRTILFQKNGLFQGSLAWNISMANPKASTETIQNIIQSVGLANDVKLLDQGLDTWIGPDGNLLSGGQKQRVCLARTFISPAPILLLDEPTASLDSKNSDCIKTLLKNLKGRKTLIMVTHNPNLLSLADQIIILQNGQITQTGCHDELLATNEWYKDFMTRTKDI